MKSGNNTSAQLWTSLLVASCVILLINFGIRASYGVFQIPIANQFGWLRSEFSFAIAIQNLAWGIGQPLFSAVAEKFTDRKALLLGIATYAIGLALSASAFTALGQQLVAILVGFGIAGTGFGVVLAIIGRASSPENRSIALGIATGAGSLGQVVGPPFAEFMLGIMNWNSVFLVFAGLITATLLTLPFLKTPDSASVRLPSRDEERLSHVLAQALKDPTYTMIFLGFFSCGFQLAFITAHFPEMESTRLNSSHVP